MQYILDEDEFEEFEEYKKDRKIFDKRLNSLYEIGITEGIERALRCVKQFEKSGVETIKHELETGLKLRKKMEKEVGDD